MSEEPPDNPVGGSQVPLALPSSKRKRSSFLRDKYARVLSIREIHPDRAHARVTKIPATLEAARARMMIIATKLLDRVEHKINLMEDGSIILPSKDYKEMIETMERAQKIMNDAFGVITPTPKTLPPAPVNNGIIINSAATPQLNRMMQAVSAAVTNKPIDLPPHDPGTDSRGS
jgi:hypothetical protein